VFRKEVHTRYRGDTKASSTLLGSCSVREDFTAAVTHRHFKGGLGEYHIN